MVSGAAGVGAWPDARVDTETEGWLTVLSADVHEVVPTMLASQLETWQLGCSWAAHMRAPKYIGPWDQRPWFH